MATSTGSLFPWLKGRCPARWTRRANPVTLGPPKYAYARYPTSWLKKLYFHPYEPDGPAERRAQAYVESIDAFFNVLQEWLEPYLAKGLVVSEGQQNFLFWDAHYEAPLLKVDFDARTLKAISAGVSMRTWSLVEFLVEPRRSRIGPPQCCADSARPTALSMVRDSAGRERPSEVHALYAGTIRRDGFEPRLREAQPFQSSPYLD